MKKLVTIFPIIVLFLIGQASVLAQSKEELYNRFRSNYTTNHQVAYEAAKEYLRKYPNDNDENVQFMKKWITAYEKVGGGEASSGNAEPKPVPTESSSTSTRNHSGTSIPRMATSIVTLPKGTEITVRLDSSLDKKTAKKMDKVSYHFTGTVVKPVHLGDIIVIPAGSVFTGWWVAPYKSRAITVTKLKFPNGSVVDFFGNGYLYHDIDSYVTGAKVIIELPHPEDVPVTGGR